MRLSDVRPGDTFWIEQAPPDNHLQAMGICPGSIVVVITRDRSGVILSVKGSRLALSRKTAEQIKGV